MSRNDYLSQKTERILLAHADIDQMAKLHDLQSLTIRELIHEYSTSMDHVTVMWQYLTEERDIGEHDARAIAKKAGSYFDTLTELYWDEEYTLE